jgi:hypothetical protein
MITAVANWAVVVNHDSRTSVELYGGTTPPSYWSCRVVLKNPTVTIIDGVLHMEAMRCRQKWFDHDTPVDEVPTDVLDALDHDFHPIVVKRTGWPWNRVDTHYVLEGPAVLLAKESYNLIVKEWVLETNCRDGAEGISIQED